MDLNNVMQYDIEDGDYLASLPTFDELADKIDRQIPNKRKKEAYASKELWQQVTLSNGFIVSKVARIDDEIHCIDAAGCIQSIDACSIADLSALLTACNQMQ